MENAKVIDVRTPMEFQMGHFNGSINIPLDTITQRVEEILAINEPIVVCCASGGRSAMACQFLQQSGVTDIHDAGPWQNVASLVK